ncbi:MULTISPECIES: GNAT family N-acetyltransferase [Cyanophyceae]|uniref:GNAT family N-acetyltransferase n=1 Tax=Cyanophyceae TaxID=3028117 RepID=UPI00168977BA|nr:MULTISPECIES: GNAT family N-acetyltransferase [Cyanophyceae]MBD1914726.1 GNAT family N-acetyltransferase [Phormidium sp. FACHB-77]MBD2030829.1 GNAT family N-acetyltransferase [Phormidium sp. FACHB-322]MBD2052428.1 GNAT family N-acetyltransferase [Leptolyngbya sp. FACHB-60]
MSLEGKAVPFTLPGYRLRAGSTRDRATVVKFMERTYGELDPQQPTGHIAATVDRYLGRDTPLWWVDIDSPAGATASSVGAIWLGQATDQRSGVLHPYVLMLYVAPDHRRRGIATALLAVAHQWAQQQGHGQISLQVFSDNPAAQALYSNLGYQVEAVLMKKELSQQKAEEN